MINKQNVQLPFYVKMACALISILLIGWFAIIGQTILIPLILGFLISILLVPACNFFERYLYFPRVLSSITTTLLFLALIAGVIFLLVNQLIDIADEWPTFQKQLVEIFEQSQLWIHQNFGISSNKQIRYLNENLSDTINVGSIVVERILGGLTRYSVLILFTFLYIVFILIYRRHLIRFVFYIFHERQHKKVISVIYTTQHMVKQYLIGLMLQMVIVFGLAFIAFSIVGIKYSFVLALLTGILNVIPYVGITISLIISALLTVASSSPSHLFLLLISFIIVHAIDANIVMPKILGSKVKVNSLVAIIGLVVGEMMWGIMGMFLSIPILALAKIIFDHIPELKPWGFLFGEEKSERLNPTVEKYFVKNRKLFFKKQKNLDEIQNHSNE